MINSKINIFLIFGFLFGGLIFTVHGKKRVNEEKLADQKKLSDADKCIAAMQEHLKHKNMTRTLGGLIGMGWDDMTNEYTLPIFKVTYKQCLVDPDNTYLVPDNVYLIPVKKTNMDKTSTVFNSYDEYKTLNSNKLTITGSASAQGKGKASASFSRESQDTKDSFVQVESIMIQNKLRHLVYELIGNEHGGLDESFIDRVNEIAKAVHEKKNEKAKFLAQVLVSNYGTHVINKATAAAEVVQNIFIKKVEEFKGETHMTSIKTELAAEFDGQAYGGGASAGYENTKKSEKKETKKTDYRKSTIHNRGGPHINRVGASNLTDAMLFADNLIGIDQVGKFIYDIIPAVPMPKYSRMTMYTVKNMVYDAIQEYYKRNTLPGCMEFQSDNYNPLANFEDGSCETPNILYSFGGVYQACSPLFSWAGYEPVEFGNQCERYERRNRATGGMSCPNNTQSVLMNSMKLQFYERTVKQQRRKCWKFLNYCWYEEVDVEVIDEIYTATYYCSGNKTVNTTQSKAKPAPNKLDLIMRHDILTTIEEKPELLQIFFPTSFSLKKQLQDQTVCEPKDGDNAENEKMTWKGVIEDFIEAGERNYCGRPCGYEALDITKLQLDMLSDYPKTLEAILPILNIPPHLRFDKDNHKNLANDADNLKNIIFNETQTLLNKEPDTIAFFGGIFQFNNNNPFLGEPKCPTSFEEIDILENMQICVSYELDLKWPIRFGGFFHCHSKKKSCPKGYSEYLAGTIDDCDHFYCIRFHTKDISRKPVLSKPPYMKYEFEQQSQNATKATSSSSSTKSEF